MTRVLIVEDQKLSRETMERTVTGSGRYELAGALSSAELAMTFCLRNPVDLILMDVVTSGFKDGIQAASEIRERLPEMKIIIVTSMVEVDYIRRSREAKVDSFWYKDISPQQLIEVMDQTMAGIHVYPEATPAVKLGLIQSTELTETEVKILRLVCEGYEYEEIAAITGTTRRTVHYHISNILNKTGYKNKTRLAVAASRCSLIVPTFPEDSEAAQWEGQS
ncbi:MAG: response regulator transcription factor [Candidatus Faecousia sp.]|nr:response regulator transcription factor [Bacillota bacterium]MDY4219326.1 response regulator transcription factor [Candidatus Faecousia sp.]